MEAVVPSPGTLALNGLVALATAAVFAYVGVIVLQRRVSEAGSVRALRLFATWWFALATLTTANAAQLLLASAGVTALSAHVAFATLGVVPLTVALWALLYYLLYIYTGNERLFWPLTIVYAFITVWFLYLIVWLDPVAVNVTKWTVTLEYANQTALEGSLGVALLALLLGPILVAATLYGSLFFRAPTPDARYRIGMVSGAFLLWFGHPILANAAGLTDVAWWPLVSRIVSLVATFMVLAAYQPPGFVRARLGITEPRPPEPAPADHRPRQMPVAGLPPA